MAQQIQQDSQGLRKVEPGYFAPENGDFPVGAGVHHAADALHRLADLAGRRPVSGALKGQMFQEMGQAGHFRRFVAGAGADGNRYRHRGGMGHSGGQHAQLIGQDGALIHHHLKGCLAGIPGRRG